MIRVKEAEKSVVARSVLATEGQGVFPFTVVEMEFGTGSPFAEGSAEIVTEDGKLRFLRDQLPVLQEQINAAIKWFWDNYPEAEGVQMQAPQVPPMPSVNILGGARLSPAPQNSYQPTPEIRQAIQQQQTVPAALASTVWPIPDDEDRTSPTTKQVQFAQRLTKDLHMDDNAIENFSMQNFQELPGAMDRQTFSKLIDTLKGMTGAPQQPARPAPPR